MAENKGKILVVGGGISGISVALESSEVGHDVILVEKEPSLGGRVSKLHQYFPKLCPPPCGLEINYKRLKPSVNVQVLTSTTIESISGEAGNYKVTVKTTPTYVNAKCVLCDKCTQVCPSERENDFNYGMDKTKAAYLPSKFAYPSRYVIDKAACDSSCGQKCVEACEYGAIDFNMEPQTKELEVATIVYATGWKPYDAKKIDILGFSKVPNVINNVMMERLASSFGPTGGKIERPSDNKPVNSVAFVQCAGSRDENHLPYCSSVCCLASIKQSTYVRSANPDSKVYVFYIDIRTPGKYEDFYTNVKADENINFIKGKVASVTEGENGQVIVEAEDIINGGKIKVEVDMVVLATGMESTLKSDNVAAGVIQLDENGFAAPQLQKPGIYSAGVAKAPVDVTSSIQDATGAALNAIQTVVGN